MMKAEWIDSGVHYIGLFVYDVREQSIIDNGIPYMRAEVVFPLLSITLISQICNFRSVEICLCTAVATTFDSFTHSEHIRSVSIFKRYRFTDGLYLRMKITVQLTYL